MRRVKNDTTIAFPTPVASTKVLLAKILCDAAREMLGGPEAADYIAAHAHHRTTTESSFRILHPTIVTRA